MKPIKIVAAVIVLLSAIACKKNGYMQFNDTDRLQFGPTPKFFYDSTKDLADTLKRSTFYYYNTDIITDTVRFDLYAIGSLSKHDRSFTLGQIQSPGANNAIPGVHYKAFSDPEVQKLYVLKAGQHHCEVPIILLRDASLKTSNVTLKFQIVANENFQLGEASKLWRKIEFADLLVQPTNWKNFSSLGKYSMIKHKFLIDSTGQKWDQAFVTVTGTDTALLNYWINLAKIALNNYNMAYPDKPLKDEFGDAVVFP